MRKPYRGSTLSLVVSTIAFLVLMVLVVWAGVIVDIWYHRWMEGQL